MSQEVYKRKGSNNYYYNFSIAGQRYRGSTFTSNKQKAKEFVSKLKQQVYDEVFLGKKVNNLSLENALSKYVESGMEKLKPHTQKDYLRYIQTFYSIVGNKIVVEITKDDINNYIAYLNNERISKSLSISFIKRQKTAISACFSYLIKIGLIEINPFKGIDLSYLPPEEKRIRFLTEFEYSLLISKCSYKLLQQVIILAVHTGFRKEELLSLTWEQIDFKKKEISLYYTKNKEHRTIPIVPTTLDVLQELYKERACNYVIQINGNRVKDFKKSFNTAKRKANIQDLHFHDLRHTFATWALKGWFTWQKQPFDLYKLQKWLGHKNIMTTQRYAHLETSDLHNMVGDY